MLEYTVQHAGHTVNVYTYEGCDEVFIAREGDVVPIPFEPQLLLLLASVLREIASTPPTEYVEDVKEPRDDH